MTSQQTASGPAAGRRLTNPASPADLWPRLDERFRAAAHALAGSAAPRVFDGVPGSTIPWLPARPFVMDAGHYLEFTRTTSRLARLVLEACRRRASTAGELIDALAMNPADLPLLDRSARLSDDLLIALRPDAVYHNGVPRYLELNIDGAVGASPNVDIVGTRFMREYARAGIGQELRTADPSLESRFAALSEWLGGEPGRRLVIPVFPVGALPGLGQDPGRFIAWLAPWCEIGRRHGLDTLAFPLEDLRLAADGRLLADGAPVDAVLRLFLYALQPRSEGGDAFAEAVLTERVAMHTPEAACLLMNKRTLAWLWSDLDLLAEPDQQLVTRHVPHTAYLPAGTGSGGRLLREARARRAELVLKPAHGYSGTEVTVGPAVSGPDWDSALDGAAAVGGYVLQEYVPPDTTPMDFVHRDTGERRAADVPFVAGPFMFGGRPAGMLVRHGGPDAGAVLNARLGALLSTALLARGQG
jgi:Glutathionylspermidine synthase preATP-grasp